MRGSLFSSRGFLIVVVSVVSLIGGALLAYWQWTRYQSATGTLQNLGYVLQWPLFGVFPAFMFYRIGQAAKRAKAEERGELDPDDAEVPAPRSQEPADQPAIAPTMSADEWLAKRAYVQKSIDTDEGTDPAEDDQALLAYNQRLAQLSATSDQHPAEERHAG